MSINKKISKSLLISLFAVIVVSGCSTTMPATNTNTPATTNPSSSTQAQTKSEIISEVALFYQDENGVTNPVTPDMIQSIKVGNKVIERKDIQILTSSAGAFKTKALDFSSFAAQFLGDGRFVFRLNGPVIPTINALSGNFIFNSSFRGGLNANIPFMPGSLDNLIKAMIKPDNSIIGGQVDENGNFNGSTFNVNGQDVTINDPDTNKTTKTDTTTLENGIDDKKFDESTTDNPNAKADSEKAKSEIPAVSPVVSYVGKWVYKPAVGLPIYFDIKDSGNNKVQASTDFMGQTYSGQADYNTNSSTEGLLVNATFKGMNAKIKLALKGTETDYDRKLDLTLTEAGGIPEIAMYQGITVTLERNIN